MKGSSLDEHKEFISDEFQEGVAFASRIIGVDCSDTVMQGDSSKGDRSGIKYQILPDPYQAKTMEERNNLLGFEDYFYKHYGKWKDRCYFDTPSEAFFNVIKAWHIWNYSLSPDAKAKYIKKNKED
jgi:hypothetical protein